MKTWLQFPKWFYHNMPVNTLVAPRLTPGGLADPVLVGRALRAAPDQAL